MKKVKDLFDSETVSGSCCIDIQFMLRNQLIVRNADTAGTLNWTGGQAVNFTCIMTKGEKFLQLFYIIYSLSGQQTEFNYKIKIDEVQSNLGKGTILYFLCPDSNKRSRILISAYREPKFINRQHYETKHQLRIYYGCQITSKYDYHNTRYFDLKRKVTRLETELSLKHCKTHYRGQPTKKQRQLTKWRTEMTYHHNKRLHRLKIG